ncbi:SLAP domain-containing protein, partial [Oceanobacillus massiliensis]|uniref:SLAP domain-containing protein n=1 Tax=Oceanobacillus massiliensis TaxID=1465765 RepID=UPI003018947E
NQIPLGFSDASNKEVAKGSFNLGGMEVNANTSKPWTFVFPANFIEEIEIDLSRWQVYLLKNR